MSKSLVLRLGVSRPTVTMKEGEREEAKGKVGGRAFYIIRFADSTSGVIVGYRMEADV